MSKIRGLDYIAFGDDADIDQELISSLTWDTELGFVTLSFTQGNKIIESIQKNDSIFAQSSEGIYQVRYFCPFRFLAPDCANIERVTLGIKSVTFYRDQYLAVVE